jgi:alpha-tubulin suppressor-like RCC1 family protein
VVPQAEPVPVEALTVFAGPLANHAFALDASGALYAWGHGGFAQLGLGAKADAQAPQA